MIAHAPGPSLPKHSTIDAEWIKPCRACRCMLQILASRGALHGGHSNARDSRLGTGKANLSAIRCSLSCDVSVRLVFTVGASPRTGEAIPHVLSEMSSILCSLSRSEQASAKITHPTSFLGWNAHLPTHARIHQMHEHQHHSRALFARRFVFPPWTQRKALCDYWEENNVDEWLVNMGRKRDRYNLVLHLERTAQL